MRNGEIANEPRPAFLVYLWRRTWTAYRPMKIRGRIRGSLRVLLGKNASIPKGVHDTALGPMRVTDYYGGCILGLNGGDIYWKPDVLDGWGGAPGQDLFDDAQTALTREWPPQ